MIKLKKIEDFLACLETLEQENLAAFFSPDATTHSSLYGSLTVTQFLNSLLRDTLHLKTIIKNTQVDSFHAHKGSAFFILIWTLKNQQTVTYEIQASFDFDANDHFSHFSTTCKIIEVSGPLKT